MSWKNEGLLDPEKSESEGAGLVACFGGQEFWTIGPTGRLYNSRIFIYSVFFANLCHFSQSSY